MTHFDGPAIRAALTPAILMEGIRHMYAQRIHAPERHHHVVEGSASGRITLLLMPAWSNDSYGGVKIAAVAKGNAARGLDTVQGLYVLMDATTAEPLATMDARELTLQRTAATSALAASLLSRTDASTMLMVGAGALSIPLIRAHSSVRSFSRILIWNRTKATAVTVATKLSDGGLNVSAVTDLQKAVRAADVISCATMSSDPLILERFVSPGTHIDLVGAFASSMRESDSALISRGRLFADTREGVLSEAGDYLIPISEGVLTPASIEADLTEMVHPEWNVNRRDEDVTIFKSVGHAAQDLAGAVEVYRRYKT